MLFLITAMEIEFNLELMLDTFMKWIYIYTYTIHRNFYLRVNY